MGSSLIPRSTLKVQAMKRSVLDPLRAALARHGVAALAYQWAVRCLNWAVEFKVLRALVAHRPHPDFLNCPSGYRAMVLTENTVRQFSRDPVNEMSKQFIDEALHRGDQCYAIVDGDTLAAYGWYAFGATPIGLPGMLLRYRDDHVYMYKGFTHDRYRGQRLHGIGMTLALRHYRSTGRMGLISYVESVNFDSLKSCKRMGYLEFGSVYVVKLFGRYFSYSSAGCAEYGFRLTCSGSGSAGLLFGK
jgi:hypothetical protein